MTKQRERIVWLDAYSIDKWMNIEDIELNLEEVETFGIVVAENSKILCIAQSTCTSDSMGCSFLYIPKCSIISREILLLKRKEKKKNNIKALTTK